MNLKKVITDRIRKLAGGDDGGRPVAELRLADEAMELWREEIARWSAEELAAQPRPLQERTAELGRRLGSAGEETPKPQLARELLANVRELAAVRFEREQSRQVQLSEGTRSYQRTAHQHELKHHHLHDEIERCRDLILQECRRRGLRLPTEAERTDAGLYAQLFQLLKAISHAGSKRMQAVSTDPVLLELETLLGIEDPAAIERFPEWLRKPAAKLLAVVQERNRYKRLLKSRGMLPENA
jgi:hypothetical protein